MKNLYYNRDGTPFEGSTIEWAKQHEYADNRIGLDALPNGYRVSTVFLGMDHSFGGGPPLIFETMVFPADGANDLDMERYSTEEGALAGHRRMVEKWKGRKHEEPE